jgi:hypothetical protein
MASSLRLHRTVSLCLASTAFVTAQEQGVLRDVRAGLSVSTAVGASSERDATLADLFGGAHDARQRGFTLRQAEMSLGGSVDDWFDVRAFLIASIEAGTGETIVELEEAYGVSRPLAGGLQFQVGTFFTDFGQRNPLHPHLLDWMNQAIVLTRAFGGDGMRGPGVNLRWSTAGDQPSALSLTLQNAHGETMPSFLASDEVYEEAGIGGRMRSQSDVRTVAEVVVALRATTTAPIPVAPLELGASMALGPNPTGDGAVTSIWGLDFAWVGERHEDEAHNHSHSHATDGFAPWSLRGEGLLRVFDAIAQVDDRDPGAPVELPEATLRDHGLVLEALFAVGGNCGVGLRGEWASGSGASHLGGGVFGRADDPRRCDRLRLSPLLMFRPSDAVTLRLQYDFDDSDALGDSAHSVWLGCDLVLGGHATHGHR